LLIIETASTMRNVEAVSVLIYVVETQTISPATCGTASLSLNDSRFLRSTTGTCDQSMDCAAVAISVKEKSSNHFSNLAAQVFSQIIVAVERTGLFI
jgi:hypothetical protein